MTVVLLTLNDMITCSDIDCQFDEGLQAEQVLLCCKLPYAKDQLKSFHQCLYQVSLQDYNKKLGLITVCITLCNVKNITIKTLFMILIR